VAVLGNDFQHKNRDFAIKVWQRALQEGQPCDLVLAGLHVKSSSSKKDEDDLIARHLDLRGRILTVGHVSSQSRAWLLANAEVVLYPTSAEGFGFIPYEAAVLGTPSVFTDFGPLREISGLTELPRTWSIEEHARDLVDLLTNQDARHRRVAGLHRAIDRYTWAQFATRLVDFFEHITHLPEVATSAVGADTAAADAAALSAVLSSRSWRVTAPLRRFGRRERG
jgi:glycosyltransferase involved in cell wall biosynthesis